MKTYIAGKITGLDNYQELFKAAEEKLKEQGHTVMNPSVLPRGFEQQEYMRICFAMIDACDRVYFLENWKNSLGARLEMEYARYHGKKVEFENRWAERARLDMIEVLEKHKKFMGVDYGDTKIPE